MCTPTFPDTAATVSPNKEIMSYPDYPGLSTFQCSLLSESPVPVSVPPPLALLPPPKCFRDRQGSPPGLSPPMQGFQVCVAMCGLTVKPCVALRALLYDLGPNPYMCARADLRPRQELVWASLLSVWAL